MADKIQIQKMFQAISPTYDLLNRLLSCNTDKWWRKKAIAQFSPLWLNPQKQIMMDLCSGTLDLALEIAKKSQPKTKIAALDFCYEMLREGKKKIPEEQRSRIWLICADIEHLPIRDNIAEGAVMGFGLRNLIDRAKGLREICRALKPGAKVAILEFSQPQSRLFRSLYYTYFLHVLPMIGGLISKNADAYKYLPDSVLKFFSPKELKTIMEKEGFSQVTYALLTFGISALHVGEKKHDL